DQRHSGGYARAKERHVRPRKRDIPEQGAGPHRAVDASVGHSCPTSFVWAGTLPRHDRCLCRSDILVRHVRENYRDATTSLVPDVAMRNEGREGTTSVVPNEHHEDTGLKTLKHRITSPHSYGRRAYGCCASPSSHHPIPPQSPRIPA